MGISASLAPPAGARLPVLDHPAADLLSRFAERRVAMFLAAAIPFAAIGAATFANTSDDPLITLRYAWNLIHHGQPVFNLGQRVEGFSSPLHMLLAALILLIPGGLVLLKLKLLSLLMAALALAQTAGLSRSVGLPRWGQLAAVFAVAGSWNFMVSASNGLETSLVALLSTGAVASLSDPARRRSWEPAAWTGPLAWARPDSLLVIALLAVMALNNFRGSRDIREIRWLVAPIFTTLALLGFRVLYYHSLLPNTYYAKRLPLSEAFWTGIGYLLSVQSLASAGSLASVLVLSVILSLIVVGIRRFGRSRALGFLVAVPVAQLLFILDTGGDWMKGGRFIVPAIPAMVILVMLGVEALLATERSGARRGLRLTLSLTAVLALLMAPVRSSYIDPVWAIGSKLSDKALVAAGAYAPSRLWVGAAAMADCLHPGQTVAYSEVGLFGWTHPELRVIDMRGLTDATIARDTPAADHYLEGVSDRWWFLPRSPVGRVLVAARPAMVISFDDPLRVLPRQIFGGMYVRHIIRQDWWPARTVVVYLRRGVRCRLRA